MQRMSSVLLAYAYRMKAYESALPAFWQRMVGVFLAFSTFTKRSRSVLKRMLSVPELIATIK